MSDCCSKNSSDVVTFDLAVIGAGSAGFSAAITAAEAGARVALIGHGTIGGTCVNVGCVPSKAMIRAVETLHVAKSSARFDGIVASAEVNDWAALVAQKQALVNDLRAAKYVDVLPNYEGITYIEGQAKFTQDGALQLKDRIIHAPKIIIATGSSPHVPDIQGLDSVDWLDSTSALELATLPRSLLVMGGGYIGVEIAQIFARAGSDVTIVTRRGLLPDAEPEVSEALTKAFADEGIQVLSELRYDRFESMDSAVTLYAESEGQSISVSAEKLLLATGRMPNTGSLSLASAEIDTNAQAGSSSTDRCKPRARGFMPPVM